MAIGINTTRHYTLQAEDAAGVTLTLTQVQGELGLGDELHRQQASEDVMVLGRQIGRMPGDEQALEVSWSALDCEEVRRFCDFVLRRGATYGPTGTAPTQSVDAIGGEEVCALKLRIVTVPPSGAPETITYDRSYWTCARATASPATSWTLSAQCYGREVS